MKKKIAVIILSLLCSANCLSQTLTRMRSYFDGNEAAAQYFIIGNEEDIDEPFEVDVTALTRGVHKMYVEVQDNEGRWSLYDEKNVQVIGGVQMATLNMFEYFFDDDPGFGEGTQVAVSGQNINSDFELSVAGLENGVHTLYMRVRDGANQWSLYTKHLIQVVGAVYENLIAAEYFFNADPGFGLGIQIPLNTFDVDENFDIDLAGLPKGVHKLCIRVQDAKGQWSLYDEHNIQVEGGLGYHEIIAAEYFFDSDPGFGNGLPIEIPAGQTFFDDEFEVVVPVDLNNGAHIMYVRVQDGSGQWSLYSTQNFNACAITIPTISVTGNPCQDNAVTLAVPSGYTSYGWSTNQTSTSISATESGTYTVTVTDSDCETTVSIDVLFGSLAVPEIMVTGGVCEGDVQTLTISGDYDSFLWSTNSSEPSINVTQQGNYSVVITDDGCEGIATVFIDFVETPTPVIIANGSTCTGSIQTLSTSGAYDSFVWSTTATSTAINVITSGTYSVTVADEGCEGSTSFDVEFYPLPNPTMNVSGGVCEGEVQTLQVVGSYDAFLWSTSAQTSFINVAESGTYFVTVYNGSCSATISESIEFNEVPQLDIVATGSGCTGGALTLNATLGYDEYLWSTEATTSFISITESGTYTVTVTEGDCSVEELYIAEFSDMEEPTIEVTGGQCEGEFQTLDAGPGYDSYLWSTIAITSFINVTQSGTYDVTVTEGSCSATISVEVEFISFPALVINVSGGNCTGDIQTLDAGPFYNEYLWTTNATTSFLNVTEEGTYGVTVSTDECTASETVDVNFILLPVPTINVNQNTLTCNQAGYNYQWYFNGNEIPGANSLSYNATQSGEYYVVISSGDCEEASGEIDFQYIGIKENHLYDFIAYPNPVSDVLSITNGYPMVQITLRDVTGKLVLSITCNSSQATVSMKTLSSGIYLLEVQQANGAKVVHDIVKE
ncbi:MAG: T9SS type A sorting domain-containing protein [Flavobacteriales bacterium]